MPSPTLVLSLQFFTSAAVVWGAGQVGAVQVDALELPKVRAFSLIAGCFMLQLLFNMKALQYVHVDTFICFRSSTPLFIALLEWGYLGRHLPTAKSWGALGLLVVGVTVYAWTDFNFSAVGYAWIGLWYGVAVFEMVYVKHVITTVEMTTWGRTFYNNAIAFVPTALLLPLSGEFARFNGSQLTVTGVSSLALSCVLGVGMSFFSFKLRALVSATSFSVVGNVCKVLTILVNIVIWDKHAGVWGTLGLLVCLVASGLYQQAPMRSDAQAAA